MIKEEYSIAGSQGKPILFDITKPNRNEHKPLLVFSHGFKGFKDWGHFNRVAQMFAQAGVVFVKHNFSHNGISKLGIDSFDELEVFSQNKLCYDLEDLEILLTFLTTQSQYKDEIDTKRIVLMGHSKGGAISLLQAVHNNMVSKLITWSSVYDFNNYFTKAMLRKWKEQGVIHFENSRTQQMMPLSYSVYEEYFRNHPKYHIPNQAAVLNLPHLIIHGTEDLSVPVSQAYELHSRSKQSKLKIIEKADHSFNVSHPFTADTIPEAALQVINSSIDFTLS